MTIGRLEAVTVCVDYADFLAETLPHNVRHFDDYVVVTRQDDRATQQLCRELGVECRVTDLMHFEGDAFAKARAIDYGLAYLRRDDWVVHLDADIWLPPMTRQWIDWAQPDPDCIYGIDRMNCVGYDAWQKFIDQPMKRQHQHTHHCLTHPPFDVAHGLPFPMGSRISLRQYGGFVPIGFFQMWHGGRHPDRRYPLRQGSAEHTDVLHALQWPAAKRRMLPEIIAVHLESEKGTMGANWKGRSTKPFGPDRDHHHHHGHDHRHEHHRHHQPHRYGMA
jgi:hypothetical protein